MEQDKEVQNVIIQERYDRMDWLSYGNQREKKGEERGISIGEERGISIGEERGISIGEERGITIGEKRGITIGEGRFANLVKKLSSAGRSADIEKAAKDVDYRSQLYREFGIR